MRVTVLFFGVLKDVVGRAEESLEIAPHATLGSLFDSYAERFATLHDKRSSILFARNSEFSKPDTMLCENDEIAFLPPVSGGSDRAVGHSPGHIFAITRDPIDSQTLASSLKRPEDGAVVIFEGVVRNNTKGRPTSYLEYDCYQEMALKQMESLSRDALARFSVRHVTLVHRLGRLNVGETSVLVVVASAHRAQAFDACRWLIDTLKKTVPIWKKETFVDGAVWAAGEPFPESIAVTRPEPSHG